MRPALLSILSYDRRVVPTDRPFREFGDLRPSGEEGTP